MKSNENSASLNEILAIARAGAVSRAWDRLVAAGLSEVTDDPAALTLKGRLLKDRARQAHGDARARLFLQSAKAYAGASAVRPDSYPLINAATMSLFAGQPDHMMLLAQNVLVMIDTGMGAGETPYWHEATRAEALMLLGRQTDARTAFGLAITAAPTAWEDRAATLRQFRQILEFRGEATDWLKGYAPPSSVHFKGMIGIAASDMRAADLAREAVTNAGAGFGYGALAAGADILLAEALAERGAELHLVLPVLSSAFRAQSVAPYGEAWIPRFDRLFEQAASVTIVAGGDQLTGAAIDFAAQVAKGAALENARRLEGQASGIEFNDGVSRSFDAATDTHLTHERSAPLVPMVMAHGQMLITLVCDQPGNHDAGWQPQANDFFAYNAPSLDAAYARLLLVRQSTPNARCAVGIAAGGPDILDAERHLAKVLRIAQCAAAGISVADSASARALLSIFPKLRTEPLGELPGAAGATEIYAIEALA